MAQNIRDIFIKNMTRLRKANNMTQLQLSHKLNISRNRVGDWEAYSCFPPIEIVINICDLFKVDLRKMLTEELKKKHYKKVA